MTKIDFALTPPFLDSARGADFFRRYDKVLAGFIIDGDCVTWDLQGPLERVGHQFAEYANHPLAIWNRREDCDGTPAGNVQILVEKERANGVMLVESIPFDESRLAELEQKIVQALTAYLADEPLPDGWTDI